jgi:effector-binding domain-containing protein
MLDFNYFCSTNENIQQYPYGFVIPEDEFINGTHRATHIICMCHGSDLNELPAIVPQGKYIMLKKSMHKAYEDDREEAYTIINDFMADNGLKLNGDSYEVAADVPEFMRRADHYHVIFLVPVIEEHI